jgi:O-antigen chain-terminating methyltransferase
LVQRAIWWHSEPRWQAQLEIDGDVAWLTSELARQVVALEEQVAVISPVVKANEELTASLVSTQRVVEDLRGRLGAVQALLEASGLGAADVAPMNYVDFEDKFRGSSDDLKRLQKDYVAYFGDPAQPGVVVDIGCGRGEMLELLKDVGHEVLGIDSDSGMVLTCQRKGLPAEQADALAWLSNVRAGTLKGIFCAQVIEHLPTRDVQRFVTLAAQALRPGGTLIVETIDPRSSHAMGHHFWADLSHVKPVHPATLAYLCELEGFADVAVVPRSRHELAGTADELPEGPEGTALRALLESVFGYQDFALVARR